MTQWNQMDSCFRLSSAASFDMTGTELGPCQLTKAMQSCALDEVDAAGGLLVSRSASEQDLLQDQLAVKAGTKPPPRRLHTDFCSQASQEIR